jgi:hypothetical protein
MIELKKLYNRNNYVPAYQKCYISQNDILFIYCIIYLESSIKNCLGTVFRIGLNDNDH